MSSTGADGATQTLYIRQVAGTTAYSTNQTNWTDISSWPLTISNSNGTPASNILKVLFTTNMTFNNVSNYFEAGSDGIQFGDTSVKPDGSRPTITIAVDNYPGLIRNGTGSSVGNAHIYIYNLVVDGTGYQLSELGAGWVAQAYFGRAAQNNFIVNCSSYGPISDTGGGIVGGAGGSGTIGTPGNLVIRGCSSYGAIGSYSGGIAGSSAGYLGSITCEKCWSEGTIGNYAGGIFGSASGQGGFNISTSAVATKCYSLGAISENGGGIFAERAGENEGSATAQDCYSRGDIGTNAGGIFGSEAGLYDGITFASNCYSSGSIGTGAGGVYGATASGGATSSTCYSANGSWSSTTAQTTLSMTPYISVVTNQPFELRAFGPSPYSLITIVSNDVRVTFSQTLVAGSSSSTGVLAGVSSYSILSGGDPTISINSTTGTLSTTSATPVGSYTFIVRAVTNSYSITTFTLTVTEAPSTAGTLDLKGKQFDFKTYTNIQEGQRFVIERTETPNLRFSSFAEYNKYLIANSAFRR